MSRRGRIFHEPPQFKKLSHALHRVYSHKSAVLLTAMVGIMPFQPQAAELDTTLPKSNASTGSFAPSNIDIPSQPLDAALKQLARTTGISVAFDSNLATGKTAPAVKGRMKADEALRLLLAGSGLESTIDKDNAVIKPAAEKSAIDFQQVDAVEVRAKRFYEIGPLPGLGLTKEEIPGNVQSLTAKDIKEAHALSLTDLMNSKLQSVNVNDYQGNPFQMDVQYRGFTAGPQIGTPQGLSVFFDGIRVNEPFGDVVNWDLVPLNALASFDVFPGSNPIFGLGTLGGALSMKTKDGFNNPGVDAEVLTGSFGRKQLQATGGWNNGTVAGFAAANIFLEDGWRENSPSKVNQVFGKGSYRADKLDLNLSTLITWNDLVGNGMLPSEMYKQDRNGVYTSPDTTDNRLLQFQLSGSYFVNDNFTITAQAYRRNSKRRQKGADVYTEWENQLVKRNLNQGEQYTCVFNSNNDYGLPDYYLVPIQNGDFWSEVWTNPELSAFASAATVQEAFDSLPTAWRNQAIPDVAAGFVQRAQDNFRRVRNFLQSNLYSPGGISGPEVPNGAETDYSNFQDSYVFDATVNLTTLNAADPFTIAMLADMNFYFYVPDTDDYGDNTPGDGQGQKYLMLIKPAVNADTCQGETGSDLTVAGPDGAPQTVDGAAYGGTGTGYVEGTPTAVLTDTTIDQETDGASIQFNWNFEKHKFMIGASVDMPSATYKSGQMLGMLDAERDAYLSPDEIRDQYAAASTEISNNNFKGHQVTKSIYASETWSPIETLHFTGALRYNETRGKNKVASRTYGTFVWDLAQLEAFPDYYNICVGTWPNCANNPTTGYTVPDASQILNPPETEKFSYYSLNPSFGTTWQATPDLNIYGNWAQGTRVPSVVELGCAFDRTPIPQYGANGEIIGSIPKSLAENRACSLPTTLSGDPYLPQIKATTWDFGMRGRFNDNVEWNLGVYRTDLKDDIYMIGFPGNRNFFDTIGDTRRQGLEAGITAAFEKWRLRLNYALTEATFQDSFWMPANDNSSSVEEFYGNHDYSRRIQVKPGNRMPGVPLHNLNATLSYQVTPKWQIGLTAVAHSFAYVRGNENNKHRQGETIYETNGNGQLIARPVQTNNPGITPGYMVFNLQTSYRINSEWTLGLRINNLLDKEYFTAGRLGRNPFSPSIYGAIGPSGYNHNSNDWLMTNFLAPGAPRAAWISLSYEFDPRK
ncbi:TonB-dependent receptor [Methylobacillus flagellatus]|uniref:TonB-dependent receptor domain-containing protein n=1 Tax=Methylobacillus flagellatus TaxID=405 RepID=UPI002853A296|nr:TonB-dependent receptor [Methylobacillus flagellatus]MDR5171310.1 TonB-dependent receptor [Methylobacillus flagellatus]